MTKAKYPSIKGPSIKGHFWKLVSILRQILTIQLILNAIVAEFGNSVQVSAILSIENTMLILSDMINIMLILSVLLMLLNVDLHTLPRVMASFDESLKNLEVKSRIQIRSFFENVEIIFPVGLSRNAFLNDYLNDLYVLHNRA